MCQSVANSQQQTFAKFSSYSFKQHNFADCPLFYEAPSIAATYWGRAYQMSRDGRQSRLSAILAADVAGYTRHVEQDTEGTVAAWK